MRPICSGILSASLLFAAGLVAAAPQGNRFGSPITEQKPVNFTALVQAPSSFEGKVVRLEGTVQAVCQASGCWMEVSSGKGEGILVKSLDDSIRLPKDCAGKRVVVQGVVTNTAKVTHHHRHEGAASCAQAEWVVSMLGVELTGASKTR